MHEARRDVIDVGVVREAISQNRALDVGDIEPADLLDDIGLVGLDLLACVAELEQRFDVEFPDDLVAALTTVDDLIYYTDVKRSQR